tara:strand:- start:415 stop:525 length:111 start_codon:yes stop_codon:yes gene_type:complete
MILEEYNCVFFIILINKVCDISQAEIGDENETNTIA